MIGRILHFILFDILILPVLQAVSILAVFGQLYKVLALGDSTKYIIVQI